MKLTKDSDYQIPRRVRIIEKKRLARKPLRDKRRAQILNVYQDKLDKFLASLQGYYYYYIWEGAAQGHP